MRNMSTRLAPTPRLPSVKMMAASVVPPGWQVNGRVALKWDSLFRSEPVTPIGCRFMAAVCGQDGTGVRRADHSDRVPVHGRCLWTGRDRGLDELATPIGCRFLTAACGQDGTGVRRAGHSDRVPVHDRCLWTGRDGG